MRSDVHHFSAADIEPIQRLLTRLGRPAKRSAAILIAITSILALLALIAGESNLATIPGVALKITMVAWLTPSFSRRTLETWIRQHADSAPFTAWDDTEIRNGGCAHGTDGALPWTTIRAAITSREYIILLSRCGPVIVPQRALDSERAADLLGRLHASGIAVLRAD